MCMRAGGFKVKHDREGIWHACSGQLALVDHCGSQCCWGPKQRQGLVNQVRTCSGEGVNKNQHARNRLLVLQHQYHKGVIISTIIMCA